jgi:hypothetical protein
MVASYGWLIRYSYLGSQSVIQSVSQVWFRCPSGRILIVGCKIRSFHVSADSYCGRVPYDNMKYDWWVQTFQSNILPSFSAFKLLRYLPSLPDGVNQDRQCESLHNCVNFSYESAIDFLAI